MFNNSCKDDLSVLLDRAKQIAEGGDVVDTTSIAQLRQHINEAKRRYVSLQTGGIEVKVEEDFLLDFSVNAKKSGARLVEISNKLITEDEMTAFPTVAEVLLWIDVWINSPHKNAFIQKLLSMMCAINNEMKDNSFLTLETVAA